MHAHRHALVWLAFFSGLLWVDVDSLRERTCGLTVRDAYSIAQPAVSKHWREPTREYDLLSLILSWSTSWLLREEMPASNTSICCKVVVATCIDSVIGYCYFDPEVL